MNESPVWFITGCSTGFGRELAKLILSRGWRAVVTARRPETIQDLVHGNEGRALALALDVTDKAGVKTAVAAAEAAFGHIDVLVNNAGYGYLSSIEEGEEEKIREQMDTNFYGTLYTIQAALPGMRARRKGHIVNYSSIGGLVSFAASGFYHASKFAVEGLSESLSIELAPIGIKVLIVEPGPFRTDWAGRSIIATSPVIEDYIPVVGARIEGTAARSGNQQGDPVRAGEAVIQAVSENLPYLRLPLGRLAYDMINKKLDMLRENVEAVKELTLGADYPDVAPAVIPDAQMAR
ncbi:oxidoreductase [Dinghuibacter silviterrae]|uniref:NADP-dependent 3-hydroxy acid dehydrogenase YdfG n=1 Tax=Dinghuibacter silviterrae TaxID=1539049 RepID=A0A4R8DFN0_9BACT|nr:oxidoreductase [Dinghuibacter silviterrae]TDW96138.1 NADP-dependent 3-hydroxy acid dehydrogenase YdfG [Dinghuibacter silviterrae]